MKFKFYSELCCDICNDIIHNHFTCPKCKGHYAGTNFYSDMCDIELNTVLECEECDEQFLLIDKNNSYDPDYWEWIEKDNSEKIASIKDLRS